MARKKKILIFPNTNTLSHFTRALTIAEWLESAGYRAHIGISHSRRYWASKYYSRCHRVSELWEPSGIPFPCPPWFSDREHIEECIQSQERVIAEIKPDLIIGIFDFIASVSSGSIPFISINGSCMLPVFKGVLGFEEFSSPEREEQKKIFNTFWAYAAQSFNPSLQKRKHPEVAFANELLVGQRNCIYEIQKICQLEVLPKTYQFIGPIMWKGWEELGEKPPWDHDDSSMIVYLNFGTLMKNEKIMRTIIKKCQATGVRLLVSSGMDGPMETSAGIFCRPFLAPHNATKISDIVICTGGAGVCYSNLFFGVPSLIVPMQPEQATNGINLQKAACGRILTKDIVFIGKPRQFEHALDLCRFENLLHEMLEQVNSDRFTGLKPIQQILQQCHTRLLVLDMVNEVI